MPLTHACEGCSFYPLENKDYFQLHYKAWYIKNNEFHFIETGDND